MTKNPSATQEMKNLDVLRAVAVLLVFFAHLMRYMMDALWLKLEPLWFWDTVQYDLGHVGVLFFFVHTALVLMFSMDRTKPVGMVGNFYIRRLFRIYPLSIVCVAIALVAQIPQVPSWKYAAFDWKEIVSNFLLIQNLTEKADVIMPLWTLTREVQMYLVLPLIYFALKRVPSSLVALILWVAFFAAAPTMPLLACFPCFMGGVFAYQLGKEKVFRLKAYAWPVVIGSLLLLHFVCFLTILPDFRIDFIVCMFLGAFIPNVIDMSESWVTRGCQSIAKYSYGIYLFHTPVIWFAFVKLHALPAPLRWATLVVCMFAVPWAAYRWIESPLIDVGRRLAERWTNAREAAAQDRVALGESSIAA